jgi:hypothetical protein
VLKEVGRSEAMKKAVMGKNPTMEGNKRNRHSTGVATWICQRSTGHRKDLHPLTKVDANGCLGRCNCPHWWRPSLKPSTEAAVADLRETPDLIDRANQVLPQGGSIKLMKEYVSVPADVNYMYIPDKKTTESEYTKYATEFLAKRPPTC